MTERQSDLTVDADDDGFGSEGSQAEFRVAPGRILLDVGYDNGNASITYTVDAALLRRLCDAALELEIAELPRSGRMIAPLDLPVDEWGAADSSFDDAVAAFLRGGDRKGSSDG